MGARWSWTAICERGHITRGFSGGSEGVCHQPAGSDHGCGAVIVQELQDGGTPYAVTDALLRTARDTRQPLCEACHQPLPEQVQG